MKGWAFLQFVFEKDPRDGEEVHLERARQRHAAGRRRVVYPDNDDSPDPEKSMEKLDAEYRQWIPEGLVGP